MNVVPRELMTEIPVSSADFRGAMRHLTGGVSVITAGRGKDITGMTVTSVSSLSVDPPTLIVSINRDASSLPLICRHGAFGVNILAADQLDVAERFAGKGGLKGADRFAGAQWVTASPACRCWPARCRPSIARSRRSSSAIHTASSSAASGYAVSTRTAALAYWHGQYVAVDQDEDAAKLAEVSLPAPHTPESSDRRGRRAAGLAFSLRPI